MKRIFLLLSASLIVATSFATASLADGDAKKGERIFKKCKACHSTEDGGKNLVGPNLFGIVDKKSASREGYSYSDGMKSSNVTWDEASLNTFLTKPKAFVSGTKMTFVGLSKESQREDVIAYLKTLK